MKMTQRYFIRFFAGGVSSVATIELDVISPANCVNIPRKEEDKVLNLVNDPPPRGKPRHSNRADFASQRSIV